jgi:hypothetical protein
MTMRLDIKGPGIPPNRVLDTHKAIAEIEQLRDEVQINSSSIDLRNNALNNGQWKAQGICINIDLDGRVYLGWKEQAAGGSNGHVVINKGDRLCVRDVALSQIDDAALSNLDRQKATASVVVIRQDGVEERAPAPLIYRHTNFAGPEFSPTGAVFIRLYTLRARLNDLQSIAFNSDFDITDRRRVAISDAKTVLDRFDDRRKIWEQFSDEKLGDFRVQTQIYTSQNEAAAFGYLLALAEAEMHVRPVARGKHRASQRGGNSRTKQRQDKAEEWHKRALPLAIGLRQQCPGLSREALGSQIWDKLEIPRPEPRQIVSWLASVAEPNGQVSKKEAPIRKVKASRKNA